jgi:chaperone required for assembly of F1-ATPase
MPLTRLASTVLDRLPQRRADAIAEVGGYAETDLL